MCCVCAVDIHNLQAITLDLYSNRKQLIIGFSCAKLTIMSHTTNTLFKFDFYLHGKTSQYFSILSYALLSVAVVNMVEMLLDSIILSKYWCWCWCGYSTNVGWQYPIQIPVTPLKRFINFSIGTKWKTGHKTQIETLFRRFFRLLWISNMVRIFIITNIVQWTSEHKVLGKPFRLSNQIDATNNIINKNKWQQTAYLL